VIQVASGETLLATKPVANGTSSVATGTLVIHGTALPPGAYTLTVYYGGDNNYLSSTVTTNLPFLAPAAAPTTALKIPASVLQGQNVTLQATVTATTGIPAGTVTFEDGSTTLGSAPLEALPRRTYVWLFSTFLAFRMLSLRDRQAHFRSVLVLHHNQCTDLPT